MNFVGVNLNLYRLVVIGVVLGVVQGPEKTPKMTKTPKRTNKDRRRGKRMKRKKLLGTGLPRKETEKKRQNFRERIPLPGLVVLPRAQVAVAMVRCFSILHLLLHNDGLKVVPRHQQ